MHEHTNSSEIPELVKRTNDKFSETLKVLGELYISPDWYIERKPWRPGENHGSRS
jgi:hypothetical protein